MPPVIAGGSRLRRVNSSTLSLNKTKKKLLTVEELYVEVLYTIKHMIGCDIDQVIGFNQGVEIGSRTESFQCLWKTQNNLSTNQKLAESAN